MKLDNELEGRLGDATQAGETQRNMNTPPTRDSWELADYGRVLRRRWWVVAVLACIGLAIGAAAYKVAHKSYTATAAVYVSALPTDTHTTPGSVDMDTEAQLVTSNAVATVASRHMHGRRMTPSQVANAVTVTIPANTNLLDIACQASPASRASDCANAVAGAYLAVRLGNATSIMSGEVASLRSKAGSLLPQVAKTKASRQTSSNATTKTVTSELQVKAIDSQFNSLLSHINSLTSQLASLQAPHNTTAGHVEALARPPSSPSSPKKLLLLPSGLLGGLIVGLIAALCLEVRDDRLREGRDLRRVMDQPVLADFAAERKSYRHAVQPDSGFAELAEYVATTPDEGCLVLLVAGATPEAGTSYVAANLAATLSALRPDVFLVSAAPGATLVPTLLGLRSRTGLTGLVAGKTMVDKVARSPRGFPELRVVGPGGAGLATAPSNTYTARRRLISELRAQARYVIVESPLSSEASPAFSLAEFADAAIVVVEASNTRRRDLDSWLRHLERIRIPVLGSVMVPADRAARSRRRRIRLRPGRSRRTTPPQPPDHPSEAGTNGRAPDDSATHALLG